MNKKVNILKMGLPIVENMSGLQESILAYLETHNSICVTNQEHMSNYVKFVDFPVFPLFGVPWAAVIPKASGYRLWPVWDFMG